MKLIVLLLCVRIASVGCEDLLDGLVNIKCGSLEDNLAQLSYFGDSLQVTAFMDDGTRCPFKQDIASATWSLTVSFTGSGEGTCVMNKVPSRQIYSIDVISFRRSPDFESQDDEKFLMECNFESYQEQQQETLPIVDNTMSQRVVENFEGQKSSSNYSISIIHGRGTPITAVEIGSLVRLKVTMSPSEEEEGLGFMPLKCEVATPDKQQRSAILVNGCGTGFPFHRKRGFRMADTFGMSPAFRMFRLNPRKGISFSCIFITCNGDCLGSTCAGENITAERIKRETLETPSQIVKTIHVSTDPKQISDNDPELVAAEVLNDKAPGSWSIASSEETDIQSPRQPLALSADGLDSPAGRQRILLVDQLNVQSFTRTVQIAVLGASVFAVFSFVALTLILLIKLKEIRR